MKAISLEDIQKSELLNSMAVRAEVADISKAVESGVDYGICRGFTYTFPNGSVVFLYCFGDEYVAPIGNMEYSHTDIRYCEARLYDFAISEEIGGA